MLPQLVADLWEQHHSPRCHLAHLEPSLAVERLTRELEQVPLKKWPLHEQVLPEQPESLPELLEEHHEDPEEEL